MRSWAFRCPLSPPAQHRLARELAEALSAIHAAGLVHRDLKPANVLLSPAGARVIDFGIAKAMDSTRLTSTGMIIGTPDYMAPEQVTDPNGSGPAADVFAMGATLVFAATVIGVAGVVVALATAGLIGMARHGGGVGSPATSSPVALSTAPATPASSTDPDTPQARYVARLCNSGGLLKSLGDSAATPPVSGDAAENRRNFLVAVDRVVGVTDVALADFTVLRDDAPTAEVKRLFGVIVDEFTAARGSFVKARDVVGRSDRLTIGAYTTGNARFADGVRNMSFAAQLLQQVKLPEYYTDEGARNPRCNR